MTQHSPSMPMGCKLQGGVHRAGFTVTVNTAFRGTVLPPPLWSPGISG